MFTLTAMYNVLEKLRAGMRIEGRDRETDDQGMIGILRGLQDRMDATVAQAYGWPLDLYDDDSLHRLVAFNCECAANSAGSAPPIKPPQARLTWPKPPKPNFTSARLTAPPNPYGPNPCPN